MKKLDERILYDGQWLKVCEIKYQHKNGKELIWEAVRRNKCTVGVVVVAQLMPSKKFVLIKQYRPAVDGYVLSFPAGLAFDNPEHALVELKEETGYVGQIKMVSPVLSAGASLINDKGRVIYIEIDETLPENIHPQQELEPSEDIEVFVVHQDKVRDFIVEQEKSGVAVASNLWYLFGLREIF